MYKKVINYLIAFTFFLVPIIFWLGHYKPFDNIKDFIFISLIFIALGVYLISVFSQREFFLRKERIYWAVIAYYIYNLISFFIFPYTDSHYLILLTTLVILFFLASYNVDSFFREKIFYIIFAVSFLSSLYGFLQFSGNDIPLFLNRFNSRVEVGRRIFTFFGNPNILGGFNAFVIPLFLSFFIKALKEKNKNKIIVFFLGLFFAIINLLMAQTRSSYLACFLSIIVFFIIFYRKKIFVLFKNKIGVSLGIIALATFFILGFFGAQKLVEIKGSPQIRLLYYSNTLKMIKDNPLFGKGIGSFNVHYPLYRDKREMFQAGEKLMEYRVEHPHSEHLEILTDLGIAGYLLFLWILVESFILLYRRNDILSLGVAMSLLGLLLDGFFTQNLRYTSIASLFWLMISFSLGDPKEEKEIKVNLRINDFLSVLLNLVIIIFIFFPLRYAYYFMHSNYFIRGGVSNYSNNKTSRGIFWFNKVLEIKPEDKLALYHLGSLYRNLQNYEKSISYYKELLEIDPNFIQANNNLALAYLSLGKIDQAKLYFEKHLKINNMYWQSYYNLAFIESEKGNKSKALEYISEIEKIKKITEIKTYKYRVDPKYYEEVVNLRRKLLSQK